MIIDRNNLTPMMQQYFEVKDQYNDCILLYRLGDFYEMFFDDAVIASKVLEIALTGRACGLEERAPMCGVPFHSVDSYIVKLVNAGHNVAVCEQAEDPAEAKGLVKREVVRVITPGTIMDTSALDDQKNNYLCSFFRSDGGIGLAFVDITTGDVYVGEYSGKNMMNLVMNVITRFAPTEFIMNMRAYENTDLVKTLTDKFSCFVRNYYDWSFAEEESKKAVSDQFNAVREGDGDILEELGINEMSMAVSALGGILAFLKETQKAELTNIKSVEVLNDDGEMQIDMYSMRNLEITETIRERSQRGSLLNVLNKTKTSMGGRMFRKMITAPLTNRIAIQNRLIAVDEFYKNQLFREEIIDILKNISDIERIITKLAYKTANCQDLICLRNSFKRLPELKKYLEQSSSKLVREQLKRFDDLSDLYELIYKTIDDEAPAVLRNGKLIKKGADPELDKIREIKQNGQDWLTGIVEEEKRKSGIKNMKLGFNKVFGYYIEVSKQSNENIPDYFIRKQTLVNAERYITPQIKELEEEILEAGEKVNDLEYNIFCRIRDHIAASYGRIRETSDVIALIDVLCSLAVVAESNGYVMPTVNNSDKIIIKDGRHPVVESISKANVFIPNDTSMDNESNQISIITGPNMAGKSTYMRQVAVIVLMAQMGSFVPASSAEIGIVDRIFTRVGASDDLSSGESTFMVEMKEVAYILNNATKRSLIILDEIGRGTSTYDGLSIAWAVVEHIADAKKCGAKTLFATHYHELTELEDKINNVKNYCIAVKKKGDDITFLRKIIRGGADESYGVEVAALAGVKKSVIIRAKEIAGTLESREQKTVNTADIKTGTKKEKKTPFKDEQIDFFAQADNPVITQLKELDLNTMTPVEALTKLFDLQAKAKNM